MIIFRILFMLFFSFVSMKIILMDSYSAEEYFGKNPGLDFYSMIDNGTKDMASEMTDRMLKDRNTYGGLMQSNPCGNNASWIQGTSIDKKLLDEVSQGGYKSLLSLADSKKVELTNDSALALTECLRTSYNDLKSQARKNQSMLERAGSMGIYTDGDEKNSDYDIVHDMNQIHSTIFQGGETYAGVTNTSRNTFKNYLNGEPTSGLFPIGAMSGTITSTGMGLGISFSEQCGMSSSGTSVENLINEDFLHQLADVTSNGNTVSTNVGTSFRPSQSPKTPSAKASSSNDFFHTIPCSSIFCIKIGMTSGNHNLLGGQGVSIEDILQNHLDIMGPISEGNLAGQKMTNNMYQLNWASLKFANLIPKPLAYVSYKPQVTRRDKRDDTPEEKDEQLKKAFQCAAYTSNLSSDLNITNTIIGGSYQISNISTTQNIPNTIKVIAPTEVEEKTNEACLDAALREGRKEYYDSFSTDAKEISSYTEGIKEEVNQILEAGKRIDKLRVD